MQAEAGLTPLRTVALVVLDSVGIGAAPDADRFGDEGSATLPHLAAAVGGVALPNLERLGLGHLASIEGVSSARTPEGAATRLDPRAAGKDTTSGHWELAGLILERPFPTYPHGFPPHVVKAFEEAVGREMLGNVAASGTEIIERLGEEHVRTGKPIVYTSADSVFQIAAHEEVISRDELYEMCAAARSILRGPDEVGRVIARPFAGEPGSYKRTSGRKDLSVDPPGDTILDVVSGAGLSTHGVGKIANIFAGRGVSRSTPTASNEEGVDATIAALKASTGGLVFTNLVDFDELYGHRNDPSGYARALEAFDARLPELIETLGPDDALFVTADHGNDPTTPSTDHSRESVPLLVMGERIRPGLLSGRSSLADCGATICELLGLPAKVDGASFATELLAE
jgi:phosphopentomutase